MRDSLPASSLKADSYSGASRKMGPITCDSLLARQTALLPIRPHASFCRSALTAEHDVKWYGICPCFSLGCVPQQPPPPSCASPASWHEGEHKKQKGPRFLWKQCSAPALTGLCDQQCLRPSSQSCMTGACQEEKTSALARARTIPKRSAVAQTQSSTTALRVSTLHPLVPPRNIVAYGP